MKCPKCGCLDDKVIESRSIKEGAGVRRRRECLSCGHRFSTCEEIIPNELKVVKRDGRHEPFEREKIRSGIVKACGKRAQVLDNLDALINGVVSGIESDFDREISTLEIGARVVEALRKVDEVSCISFASVYKDFRNLDEFIREIRTMNREKKNSEVKH